jgi:ribonuclease P protein component
MQKKYRLRANADFQRLRSEGRTLLHPLLMVSMLPNGLEHARFGFAVGRRIGKATVRNRIKRWMREAIRIKMREGELARGWDVVFIARYPIRGASYHQVDDAIGLLLRRAGLVSQVS